MYEYRCTVTRVVDGDTLDLDVDLGLRVHARARVRLVGVDTPEVYGVRRDSEEAEAGRAASLAVREWIDAAVSLTVRTQKDRTGKYGRWLATLVNESGASLNDYLVELGHAS
jgi:micrococcal nuclease